jgi:AraC-like DNA-binding protein/mannose-6-phosphate isomerase-like protein (cupin superfamily)
MMNKELFNALATITEEEKRFLEGANEINRNIYMESSHNVVNSKKLLDQNKLISVRVHSRFVHFPEHTHDYIEVIYMCSGQTTHIINGQKVVLKEGELLFLSQNARQEIYPAGEKDIAVNFITLPQFFDNTLTMLNDDETPLKKFIIDCLKNQNSSTPYLLFEVSDILPIQNLVENLIWTLFNGIPNKRKINQTTMGLLFLQLLNYTDRLSYVNEKEELILQTLRYVEEHYNDGSLQILSEILHYDFAWLSREIKRKTGKTYTEHVQRKRISQACYLLKNTSLGVDEIAEQVGYDNISYFHRLFKKDLGITPNHYRKNAKKSEGRRL